ncbi:hypothetical protein GA029_27435 [Bacteroides thetaiotaomicron]|jgi:hypothetical protein|nr:hypothetical protein GA029_27435 [Bacteroides thetaiotaomicron]
MLKRRIFDGEGKAGGGRRASYRGRRFRALDFSLKSSTIKPERFARGALREAPDVPVDGREEGGG